MILNYEEDDLSTGYKYERSFISPGWREFLSGTEFINSEGKRYFSVREEPRILFIRAETEDGRTGTYVKKW